MPIYQPGSRGKKVKQIQQRLKALGYYDGAIDGIYGPGTESAVKEFQRAEGLAVDGVLGPQTWTALFENEEKATGSRVKKIQRRLKELGYYEGAIDGIYGPSTEGAVKAFQREEGLAVDGIVGPNTWEAFFEDEPDQTGFKDKLLAWRCLALTGSFETGDPPPKCFAGLSGDFDGQGISMGCLQWNLGQGTLQPILSQMYKAHPNIMAEVFEDRKSVLESVLDTSYEEQMQWARSIQEGNELEEPWRSMFKTLGHREAFQQMQVEAAHDIFEEAVRLTDEYKLQTERAIALMFDIKVQNGSISELTENQIRNDISELPAWEEGETARLCIIANRRSEASKPRWIEDVRSRKLTIATGRGAVHGIHYVLNEEYNIRLKKSSLGV